MNILRPKLGNILYERASVAIVAHLDVDGSSFLRLVAADHFKHHVRRIADLDFSG